MMYLNFIHARFIRHRVNPRDFAFSFSFHGQLSRFHLPFVQYPRRVFRMIFQNIFCQSKRSSTGGIQFMNMMGFLDRNFIIGKSSHRPCQPPIQMKKYIHPDTIIGRVKEASPQLLARHHHFVPSFQPSRRAGHHRNMITETPIIIIDCHDRGCEFNRDIRLFQLVIRTRRPVILIHDQHDFMPTFPSQTLYRFSHFPVSK